MPAVARCSECSAPLVDAEGRARVAGTKTCSNKCRSNRGRRIARTKAAGQKKTPYQGALADVAAAVHRQTKDVAHDVMVEELRPIVREAMTADVLRGIDTMVKLTPGAIAVLQNQLQSEDETIAQRAATLLLKYTMGNPSVAPPPTQQAAAPMSVVFNIPRPGDTLPSGLPEGEEVALQECTDCGEHKPPEDFVGASPRCQECFDKLHETLRTRMTPTP